MNFGTILGVQITKLYNEFPEEKVCGITILICVQLNDTVCACACACVCVCVFVCAYVCVCVCVCVCVRACAPK